MEHGHQPPQWNTDLVSTFDTQHTPAQIQILGIGRTLRITQEVMTQLRPQFSLPS